jgi:hypothetical protein
MDQQLVIKLTSKDGNGVPVGIVQSPPMLYSNLKALYPGVTFSEKATASETEPYGYGVFEWAYPNTDLLYTKSVDSVGLTKHSDGVWRDTFIERDATLGEIKARTDDKAFFIRQQRNGLLIQSDFSQLLDAPDYVKNNLTAWNQYRQNLRDLSLQSGFPWSVTFPTKPSN